MEAEYVIAMSVSLGVIGLFITLGIVFKLAGNKLERYIQHKFDEEEIVAATTRANFFGLKSKGFKQIRGNAAIVLTKDKLYSIRSMPLQENMIPFSGIEKVTLPRSFLGKSIFRKLLCVHYLNEGQQDEIAWAVKNPEYWKTTIENLIK
ncbi:MAG: hypothetical protein PVI97_07575 [Candidatus Thiodiazotropha sp.]|jgi:hypothetical protein